MKKSMQSGILAGSAGHYVGSRFECTVECVSHIAVKSSRPLGVLMRDSGSNKKVVG